MRLVACPDCRTQFDITGRDETEIKCTCGATVRITEPVPIDARVSRCGSCGAPVDGSSIDCPYCGGTLLQDQARLGLICPECYARNDNEAHYCTSCGIEFAPQAVPQVGEALKCPCDGTEMTVRSVAGVRVQECAKCLGMWVPEDNFDSLIRKAVEAQRDNPTAGLGLGDPGERKVKFNGEVRYRPCPFCGDMMNRKNYDRRSGIIIDLCGDHGVWLDSDELEEIAAYIADGGLRSEEATRPSNPEATAAGALLTVQAIKNREKTRGFVQTMKSATEFTDGGVLSLGRLLQRLLGS